MNASIYGMNHSPLTQEPDSRPLDFENDILALSGMYLNFTDHEHAFEFAKSLTGKSYSEKCAAYVTALDELAALWIDMGDTPVSELEIDALVAFANDTEAPACDPEQQEAEEAMREEAMLDDMADARREYKYGKGL